MSREAQRRLMASTSRTSTETPEKKSTPSRSRKKTTSSRAKKASPSLDAAVKSWRKGGEITGLVLVALSVALCLALVSSNPADIETSGQVGNWIGPVGAYAADILLYIFGIGSFFVVAVLFMLGGIMLVGHRPELKPSEFVGQGIFVLSGAIFSHLFFKGETLFGHQAGGLVGEMLGSFSVGLIGEVGSYILAVSMSILALMLVTDMSLGNMIQWCGRQVRKRLASTVQNYQTQRELRRRLKAEAADLVEDDEDEEAGWFLDDDELEQRVEAQMRRERKRGSKARAAKKHSAKSAASKRSSSAKERPTKRRRLFEDEPEDEFDDFEDELADEPPVSVKGRGRKDRKAASKESKGRGAKRGDDKPDVKSAADAAPVAGDGFEFGDTLANLEAEPAFVLGDIGPGADAPASDGGGVAGASSKDSDDAGLKALEAAGQVHKRKAQQEERAPIPVASGTSTEAASAGGGGVGGIGPNIVESEAQRQARAKREQLASDKGPVKLKKADPGEFVLPHLSFLDYENPDEVVVDKDLLRQMAMQLEKTLSDFGVNGKIVEICPGPVITMFEFSPAPGVKLSKIANLSDDLAMALAAISVRIIAPIPGKGVVGIEVPNPSREMVFLKEIIADDVFQASKARMPLALGKNTEGGPVVADLASMPHLLVAGATGSGKSVAVNTMIVSLLFRYTPNDVRLIMVDPKMLEFSIYEGIPQLLLPVVTDPKQAAVALNWAVNEMERRYQLLANMSVRNIINYNKKVEKLTHQCEQDLKAGRTESEAVLKMQLDADGTPGHQRLPYIVVIIDEFADLMMVASKDVEQCVARLAQKARAAGIHLILATQRPSVDVITGLIKANFPTRIALRVAQKTDSRTILDSNGAENLLGKGDMLFLPPGSSQQQRVHGAFVSETEIERIVEFLKEQGSPQYDDSILAGGEEESDDGGKNDDEEYDEHYDEAIYIVTSERRASISMLQRKLRVGYNRAARMIERMEQDGVVGPSDGSRPREVLAPPPA